MISQQKLQELKFQTLKHFWGYDEFRDPQEQIVDAVLAGEDTLVLLPTGGGKSLCYQLPALFMEGICLVISPLLALMKDQVYQLKTMGIEAEYLSAELDDFAAEEIFNLCKEGITKLLYVSPERLTNAQFIQNIENLHISLIAVDEAHCISEWGQDFRPSYQNIKKFRSQFEHVPLIALTATATPKVLSEISEKLELKNPKVFKKSFNRENIRINCEKLSDKYQRIYSLFKFNQASGIIYTRTRKDTEQLTQFLQGRGLKNVDFYHAGLSAKERHSKQNAWLKSDKNVLISTNAFGMGINKENVRFVIHLSPSNSVENYYQEIGRAGRDGAESFAFLFWNEAEIKNFDDILKNQIPTKSEFIKIITYLYSTFQIAEHELPEQTFQLHKQRIINFTKCSSAKITNVLNFLHTQEIIYLNAMKSKSSIELKISAEDLDLLPKKDSYFIEMLLRNLSGATSHKVFFNENVLSAKLGIDAPLVRERIRELAQKNYLEYIDGAQSSVKFLQHRNDTFISGKYWKLFEQIQRNKILKWEEMKFYVKDEDYCKNKLILSYFGEKNSKDCGKCSVCEDRNHNHFSNSIISEIIIVLSKNPATLEDITAQLHYRKKENILEELITLLDAGKIKMLNFRTYTLA